MSFNPSSVQFGLGHSDGSKGMSNKLDDKQSHEVNGHEVIFIQVDDVLKAVCKKCSVGREIPFKVLARPKAKRYIIGEFLHSNKCIRSR